MENTTSFEPPDFKAFIDAYSPFFREFKKRMGWTLLVFVVATILGFAFYEQIIRFLIEILSLQGINIVFTSPFQFINLAISCGMATGVVFALPLLIYQLLRFIKPALREKEYKMVMRLLPFSFILFLFGFGFGTLIMKWQIEIFLDRSVSLGIGNILDISRLLTTVLLTSVLMGISFQFPIILLFLLRLGIIKRTRLSAFRPWVYLASFIFAVLLPPDSILADILLALPLAILFEVALLVSRISERKRA